jgi:glycosyltransferase involved in cell wall biosynthesis
MKLSVITICKNVGIDIEKTLLSIINQTYKNIEIIIIDGNSSDNTTSYINNYIKKITHFISEEDSGIYHAMNKGLKLASGDLIYFLNAGDIFFSNDVVEKIIYEFKKNKKIDIIYGNIETIDLKTKEIKNQIYGKIFKSYFFYTCFVQQAMFFRSNCFKRNGNFDESFRISGDYDWIVRGILKNKLKMFYTKNFLCSFQLGGISSNEKFKTLHQKENNIIKKYFTKKDKFFIKILRIKPFHFYENYEQLIEEKISRKLLFKIIGWSLN